MNTLHNTEIARGTITIYYSVIIPFLYDERNLTNHVRQCDYDQDCGTSYNYVYLFINLAQFNMATKHVLFSRFSCLL